MYFGLVGGMVISFLQQRLCPPGSLVDYTRHGGQWVGFLYMSLPLAFRAVRSGTSLPDSWSIIVSQ